MGFLGNLFSGLSNFIKPLTSMFSGGAKAAAPMLGPQTSGALFNSPNLAQNAPKGGGMNWMSSIFPGGTNQGIAGIAAPLIGNMFSPKVKQPDFQGLQSVQAMQNFKPGNSVSPQYQNMLQNNTDRLRDKRIKDLQATYRSARPGTDYLTDTNYQTDLAEIERGVQTQMADDLASAEGTFSSQEQNKLSELAQLDIASLMYETGLSAQEANDFKSMFSNVGNMFLTNATRKPGSFDLSSLFGGR